MSQIYSFRSALLLSIFLLNITGLKSQGKSIRNPKLNCEFPVFSKDHEHLAVTVFYYSNTNKRQRSTSGFNRVYTCNELKDSIRTVTVLMEHYFIRVIKLKEAVANNLDTIFLTRLANDSICKLEGLKMRDQNNLDLFKSKIALDSYINFIITSTAYKYTLLVNENNNAALAKANAFLTELFKRDFSLKNKIALEKISDPKLGDELFIKSKRLKNKFTVRKT